MVMGPPPWTDGECRPPSPCGLGLWVWIMDIECPPAPPLWVVGCGLMLVSIDLDGPHGPHMGLTAHDPMGLMAPLSRGAHRPHSSMDTHLQCCMALCRSTPTALPYSCGGGHFIRPIPSIPGGGGPESLRPPTIYIYIYIHHRRAWA